MFLGRRPDPVTPSHSMHAGSVSVWGIGFMFRAQLLNPEIPRTLSWSLPAPS